MNDTRLPRGIWAATLTPIDARLQPDAQKAIAYYHDLLDRGCDGLNVLGTTGEAMSFSARQRLEFMEALAHSDLPMQRVMVGTGAPSLDDAVALTRAAFELGFVAALVMPPFFFRDASDDGIVYFYDELLSRVPNVQGRMLLYNFPAMSGITFSPTLVDRIVTEFSERIVGLKDSSNDRALQCEVITRHPRLAVFPGSEAYLLDALAYGAAGCISGTVALWSEVAQSVYRCHGQTDPPEAATAAAEVRDLAARRALFDGVPFIPAVRSSVAQQRGDESWRNAMPPLVEHTATLQRRT